MPLREPYMLMLEDDSDDRYITQSYIAELGFDIPIEFISNSEEVLPFLDRSPAPMLILIDYNIQPENGLQILQKLKAHPHLSMIPVVLLSDSEQKKFVEESYRYGVSTYIVKPRNVADTRKKIETFFRYWLEVAQS